MQLTIIIVNYNTAKLLADCLNSISNSFVSFKYEVYVVDNNSSDNSVEILNSFPWVRFITNNANVGYGVANNIGIRNTAGRYILFLNPDIYLPPNSIEALVSCMESNPGIGALGPKLVKEDGSLDKACRRSFPTPIVWFYHSFGLGKIFPKSRRFNRYNLDFISPDLEMDVDSLVGACMMVRREAINQVGLFDERFFLYGEDIDLCLRIKQEGWTIRYFPAVTILHYKRRATSQYLLKSIFEFYKSMYLFHRKHYYNRTFFIFNLFIVLGIALLYCIEIAKNYFRLKNQGEAGPSYKRD